MEKLSISRQSWHFSFNVTIYKVLFPICTLTRRVNNYVYCREKVQIGEMRVQIGFFGAFQF